jgi:hypothetical protein
MCGTLKGLNIKREAQQISDGRGAGAKAPPQQQQQQHSEAMGGMIFRSDEEMQQVVHEWLCM